MPSTTQYQTEVQLMTPNKLQEKYSNEQVKRFIAIFESYAKSGKTRERYIERLELEFKQELTRA